MIVVDLPGHGDSSIPAADDDVSMSLMLDSLREVSTAITCLVILLVVLSTRVDTLRCRMQRRNATIRVPSLFRL